EIGQVADAGDGEMLDRARRGLADRGRYLGGATLWHDDTRDAGALGRAADRAEVLRVLHLVERHHEWLLCPEQLLRRDVYIVRDLGAHSLVLAGAAPVLDLLRTCRLGPNGRCVE